MAEPTYLRELIDHYMDLYNQGAYAEALDWVTRYGPRFPHMAGMLVIWRLCMFARLGETDRAIQLLEESLNAGYSYMGDALRGDPDLEPLQNLLAYQHLVERSDRAYQQALADAKPELNVLEPATTPPWPLLVALHGDAGANGFDVHWKCAADQGWLVALPRSSQRTWVNDIQVWEDTERALAEVQQHLTTIPQRCTIDPDRVVIAGFSRGGSVGMRLALAGAARGFIGVEAMIPEPDEIESLLAANRNPGLRIYLISGKTLDSYADAEKACVLFREHDLACEIEGTSNAYHGFAPEFDESLQRALAFIG